MRILGEKTYVDIKSDYWVLLGRPLEAGHLCLELVPRVLAGAGTCSLAMVSL